MLQEVLALRERVVARRYAAYGRVYRVVFNRRTGMYWAVGRARGLREHYLDKLGARRCRAEMQGALDGWARRKGAREVAREQAGEPHGGVKAYCDHGVDAMG